jgi:hypothetical protein
MLRTTLLLLILFLTTPLLSQKNGRKADEKAIKDMCGCYRVNFRYAETFPGDTAYDRREPSKTVAPVEWIFVDEESEDEIVIQHLLVVRDSMVIKHWRQDWTYEGRRYFSYDHDQEWDFVELSKKEAKGNWVQRVYQVDDGPRYGGSGAWVHAGERPYWQDSSAAPLPRREAKKRSDYNVMVRRNRHVIKTNGWLHEQDNHKIIRDDRGDSLLVMEKGYNRYWPIDSSKCRIAREWWDKNKDYWRTVREVWSEYYKDKERIAFKEKVDGKKRWKKLFGLQRRSAKMDEEALKKKVRKIIRSYEK